MSKKTIHLWSAALALALGAACVSEGGRAPDERDDDEGSASDESSSGSKDEDDAGDEGDEGEDDEDADDEGEPTKDGPTKRDASTRDAGADGGAATSDPKDKPAADAGESSGDSIPCEVEKVIAANCLECHGATPKFGAGFSLTTLESFQGPSDTDDEKKMHEVALTRVTATDKQRMPPTSFDPLSDADLKTLTDWLDGGAQAGAACGGEDAEPDDDDDEEPATPNKGGSGSASAQPIEYDDPELKCYPLTAFAANARDKPYSVPTTPDLYVAFNIKAPWKGTQYIRSFRSIIDNAEVLHHWLLFKQPSGGSEGVTPNAIGIHPEGEMLYGWAPGGDDMYFDPDVGMEVDGSVLYQLELHYNNKTGSAKPDASGVEVCVTPTKPKHVAGLSWLGTDSISGQDAMGSCSHTSREPIHLIAAQPHMHVKGKHMKVDVVRQGGKTETIHDEPFDFDTQRSYLFEDLVINPGDVINTTCEYSMPARFGKGTNEEMCYFFSIHWPAGALKSPGVGALLHGENSCM